MKSISATVEVERLLELDGSLGAEKVLDTLDKIDSCESCRSLLSGIGICES